MTPAWVSANPQKAVEAMKFYQTVELLEAEVKRLRQRESDLVNSCASYMERARKAEARIAELEGGNAKARVEMTGEGASHVPADYWFDRPCEVCGAQEGTMHKNGCANIGVELQELDEGTQVVR